MSAIARSIYDASEDTQEVKTYLEDLKSQRNSPLEIREQLQNTSRISEENEDESSSEAN